jgi:hypothetical protein
MKLGRRLAVLAVLLAALGMSGGSPRVGQCAPLNRCAMEWNVCTADCDTIKDWHQSSLCRQQCDEALRLCKEQGANAK